MTDHVQEAAALWVGMTKVGLGIVAMAIVGGVWVVAWYRIKRAWGYMRGEIEGPGDAPWRDDEHPSWKGRGGWRDD